MEGGGRASKNYLEQKQTGQTLKETSIKGRVWLIATGGDGVAKGGKRGLPLPFLFQIP